MEEIEEHTLTPVPGRKPEPGRALIGIRDLLSLSGRDVLNRILDQPEPKAVVQSMSRVDFYWLVKQVGEEDALPLLRLASVEQWEHVLDMEIWGRDRLSPAHAASWVGRLLEADPRALVEWLYGEGELFVYYFLFHHVQVEAQEPDEALDLPDDFFTLDNMYYIRVKDKEHEQMLAGLLRQMAAQDYERYQSLLLTLSGVITAELEEELYRRRNVRLAEDGFLPFEEAVSLYSYVKAETVSRSCSGYLLDLPVDAETGLVPLIPLSQASRGGLFVEAAGRVPDPIFLDRLRLEFAGLCNQMVSADQLRISGMDVLVETCRKAAGYLSLGLEALTAESPGRAEDLLRLHPLILVFQVGFSLTLELKWEAERWLRQAWFGSMGYDFGFWGDDWGGMLEAILRKRPLYFPPGEEGGPRHFETLSEVQLCREGLREVFAVDSLLRVLHSNHPSDTVKDPLVTFQTPLFTFWARRRLELEPGFEPISLTHLKSLFSGLRKGKRKPPYRMEEHRGPFIEELLEYGRVDFEEQERAALSRALGRLWDEFSEDYARVALADMEGRFSKFISIRPETTDAPP